MAQGLLSQPKTGQEAVQKAKTLKTVEQQRDYLVGQAERFLKKKDIKTAMDIAQYVLVKIDKNSDKAKELLLKSQNALSVQKQLSNTK